MPDLILCPQCSRPVGASARRCPACGKDLTNSMAQVIKGTGPLPDLPNTQITPEILVPRLGEYLLEKGMITRSDLQRALDYQQKKNSLGQPRLLGRALIELGMIDRERLDQVVTGQIASLHAALQDTNRQLEVRVQQRTHDLEKRLVLIQTAAEITRQAISATNLTELLERTVDLIVQRLHYDYAAIYLVDENETNLNLGTASGTLAPGKRLSRIGVDESSFPGWVALHNQPRFNLHPRPAPDAPLAGPHELAEAALPMAVGQQVIGVLYVQTSIPGAFEPGALDVLQIIAHHVVSVDQNFRLLDQAQYRLEETSHLYEASQSIARARTPEEIYQSAQLTLQRTNFVSLIFSCEEEGLRLVSQFDPLGQRRPTGGLRPPLPEVIPVPRAEIEDHLPGGASVIIQDNETSQASGLPVALLSLPRWLDCPSLGFIPVISQGALTALFVVGSRNNGKLSQAALRVHASLAEMASIALDKVNAVENMEKRLVVLQTLDSVSKTISMETDLENLFRVTHQQIVRVMGEVNFLIALYDQRSNTIEIPYAYEEGNTVSLPTIPLGQGLTSIIIHTRQPLLLVEDTERRAAELGARVYGASAKSWLGVPLMVAGDVIGAIVVQDLEHEYRFDEDDQRLLTNLATQVAITVRNVRLLDETRRNAEYERTVTDITTRLWASTNTDTILRTAIQELGRNLRASRGMIKLEIEDRDVGY